jgi:hypothetical protein
VRPDQRRLLALSHERERWRAYAADSFRQGYALGQAAAPGEGWTTADLMNAYLAGQRSAKRHKSAFDAGFGACLERFAEQIGGRMFRPYPGDPPALDARWTRHHPGCRIGRNGRRPCKRLGCLPGPREEFGKPSPWDTWPEGGRRD